MKTVLVSIKFCKLSVTFVTESHFSYDGVCMQVSGCFLILAILTLTCTFILMSFFSVCAHLYEMKLVTQSI